MCVNSSKGGLGLGPESPKGHRSLHWKGEGHRSLHPKGGKVEGRRGRQGLGRMQAPGGVPGACKRRDRKSTLRKEKGFPTIQKLAWKADSRPNQESTVPQMKSPDMQRCGLGLGNTPLRPSLINETLSSLTQRECSD